MKKLFFTLSLLAFLIQLSAQVSFTALTISPKFPQANSMVTFEYNSNYSPLIRQKNIETVVYLIGDNGYKIAEPLTKSSNGIYKGSFKLDSSTYVIAISFSAGEDKDINAGKGYIIPVYDRKKLPVQGYYGPAANLQVGFGENLFGMKSDPAAGLIILEEAVKVYPNIKLTPNFLNTYFTVLTQTKKNEASNIILNELASIEQKNNLTEADYNLLIQGYNRYKKKTKADSLSNAMKAIFPDGTWKKNEKGLAFNKEKNIAAKRKLFDDYFAMYGADEKNQFLLDNFRSQLADAYWNDKQYKLCDSLSKYLNKSSVAMAKNNRAWAMAEKDEDLQTAKQMAETATAYAKSEMEKPTEKKPDYYTKKQWADSRKYTYSMFGDTYAFILYKLGDYKSAYPIVKDAATIRELKDAAYNERYALTAEKVLPAAEAIKLLEQFVVNGTASDKIKDLLKEVYKKTNPNETGFDAYLSKLAATASTKKRAEIEKGMLNEATPSFTLKDFDGKTVSLADFKGKTVVVDFWATWCGPCIESMPGMKKAMAKYKDDENVKFLFVDTWESADDKLKNAKDFMEKKNYPFHVLMDDENKMVEDFKVRGIPTKFIIDKEGKIRFKSVGFSGKDEMLVEELSTMIDLVSK